MFSDTDKKETKRPTPRGTGKSDCKRASNAHADFERQLTRICEHARMAFKISQMTPAQMRKSGVDEDFIPRRDEEDDPGCFTRPVAEAPKWIGSSWMAPKALRKGDRAKSGALR